MTTIKIRKMERTKIKKKKLRKINQKPKLKRKKK